MIPNGTLSSSPVVGKIIDPVKTLGIPLVDYERAGVALYDASEGLQSKVWKLQVIGENVFVSAENIPRQLLFSAPLISEAALAFDQAMRPFVAYVQDGVCKYYWFDTSQGTMVHTTLGSDCRNPRCTTDEKRPWHLDQSDIVLFYLRESRLCARYQRERFQTEHILQPVGAHAVLISVAMSDKNRLQIRMQNVNHESLMSILRDFHRLHKLASRGFNPFTEPPPKILLRASEVYAQKYSVHLAECIYDLLTRAGISPSDIDLSKLDDISLEGLKVASESGAAEILESLQHAFFFDPIECDTRFACISRGQNPVDAITHEDLIARNDATMAITRIQEIELLRKVNVTTLDSSIDYAKNTQTAQRISPVHARGESSIEIPIVTSPLVALQIAQKRLRLAWAEVYKYTFSLPTKYSHITPTDVIIYTDAQNTTHRIRINKVQESYGRLDLEGTNDAPWIYQNRYIPAPTPQPNVSTTPGIIGKTFLTVLNLPVIKDSDDALGYYLAVYGIGSAWQGATVQMRRDQYANVEQEIQMTASAILAQTMSPLLPEADPYAPSQQTLKVVTTDQLFSVTDDVLQTYQNRLALQRADGSWEIIQYQYAQEIEPFNFVLSGLHRGRYATSALEIPVGALAVVLNDALTFVALPSWALQESVLQARAISLGTNPDTAQWLPIPKSQIASQTEWPVHTLTAQRDASNTVTVRWIGRARLGVEIAPKHSQYFAGYRVMFSDGYSVDTKETSHSRPNVPPYTTVRVAPINTFTGLGPSSKEIPT